MVNKIKTKKFFSDLVLSHAPLPIKFTTDHVGSLLNEKVDFGFVISVYLNPFWQQVKIGIMHHFMELGFLPRKIYLVLLAVPRVITTL